MKRARALLFLIIVAVLAGFICQMITKRKTVFSEQTGNPISGKTNIIHAEYRPGDGRRRLMDDFSAADYTYIMDHSSSGDASVNLSVTLWSKSRKDSIILAGKIEQVKLPSGFVFWEGPLDGFLTADDLKIPLIAGFLREENEKEICLTITFGADGNSDVQYPLVLTIGDGCITDELNEELKMIQEMRETASGSLLSLQSVK